MKLDPDEKDVLESFERGEWRSVPNFKQEKQRSARAARTTFRKDRRLNIRISTKDLEALQKSALEEGLPYQALLESVIHKYAVGRLRGT